MASNEFTYFDQYTDVEVDLSAYINLITATTSSGYKYSFTNLQPVKTNIKNLFIQYDFVLNYKQNVNKMMPYTISDYELVEQVSYNVYNTADYWWIIYAFNQITNPFVQWPVPQERINELATDYVNNEGKYSRDTYYKLIFEENENKRNIILPRADVIPDIIWAYREQILKG